MQIQRIIKKALILTIGYIFLIFGIFILQFKNASALSEYFGAIRLSLSTQTSPSGKQEFQNKFNISYDGINFSVDEKNPVKVETQNFERDLIFNNWEKTGDTSFRLYFSENVNIDIALSSENENGTLTVAANLPEEIKNIYIPYSISSKLSTEKQNNSNLSVTNKNSTWNFSATEIDDSTFTLTPYQKIATYKFTTPTEIFTFDSIPNIEQSSYEKYAASVSALKDTLISNYRAAFRNGTTQISEAEIVSFVAAMGEKGQYNEALEIVPPSYKTSPSRTYLSAPYFNSLVSANTSLNNKLNSLASSVRTGLTSSPIETLAIQGMANYVNIHRNDPVVAQLLSHTASEAERIAKEGSLSIDNATAILSFYNKLSEEKNPIAQILQNAAKTSVLALEAKSSINENTLVISEDGNILSVLQTAQLGDALLQYGNITNNEPAIRAGYMILNTLLENIQSFERKMLSDIYAIIVHGNPWYPHIIFLENDTNPIWVWTCAQSVTLSNATPNSTTINFMFPVGGTHHAIIQGIQNFNQILIYEMPYRSDPRFETYNASGYAYQADTKTLLIKSRHRSQKETITLNHN